MHGIRQVIELHVGKKNDMINIKEIIAEITEEISGNDNGK